MEIYPLIDIQTNMMELLHFSMIDEDSRYKWLDDFEETLTNLNIHHQMKFDDKILTFKLTLYTYIVEVSVVGEEDAVSQLQQDSRLQDQCVKQIRELLHDYNEALSKEFIAQIPNAHIYWKNDRFYVEIAPNQQSLDVEFKTVQFEEDFDEYKIGWEYLL